MKRYNKMTVLDILDKKLKVISGQEKEIAELAKAETIRIVREVTGADADVTLFLHELRHTDYEDAIYGMGVTLYDRHSFCETGLLDDVTVTNGEVKCGFTGAESDCEDELSFEELKAWSQTVFVAMMTDILNDVRAGKVAVTVDGPGQYVLTLKED